GRGRHRGRRRGRRRLGGPRTRRRLVGPPRVPAAVAPGRGAGAVGSGSGAAVAGRGTGPGVAVGRRGRTCVAVAGGGGGGRGGPGRGSGSGTAVGVLPTPGRLAAAGRLVPRGAGAREAPGVVAHRTRARRHLRLGPAAEQAVGLRALAGRWHGGVARVAGRVA